MLMSVILPLLQQLMTTHAYYMRSTDYALNELEHVHVYLKYGRDPYT